MTKKDSYETYKTYYDYLVEKHRSLDLELTNLYKKYTDEEIKKKKVEKLRLKDEMKYYIRILDSIKHEKQGENHNARYQSFGESQAQV